MLLPIFLISFLSIQVVHSWGDIGHGLIAEIAQTFLTNDSQTFVRDHLPWYTTGNLSMLASWPDTILYPNSNPVDYLNWQWSKELHYVNTPDWNCTYDRIRDCNWTSDARCVDGAIQNFTSRLANGKLDAIQRGEALRFLVHFIGDAHQPLHAGFTGDRGGNDISGTFYGKSTNLHKLWDTAMIDRRISTDFFRNATGYYMYLLNLLNTKYAGNITQWTTCRSGDESTYLACSTDWIVEDTVLNCALVYRDENERPLDPSSSFHFSDVYYNTRMVYLEQRLLQSAVRLGAVINKVIQSEQEHRRHRYAEEFCTGIMLLFIVVCFEIFILCLCCTYCCKRQKSNLTLPLNEKS